MNFKLVSKENLGCVILLLLVVVLSLSKTFNVTPETHLGRVILILFVLVISYLNNILGVVAVLFIIIILSGNNMFYQEGFDSNMSNTSSDSSKSDISKDTKKEKEVTEVQKGDNTVDVSSNQHIPIPPTSTMPQIKPPSNESSIASSAATEGFDIIGLENDMKKGKQSNSIPVNAFMRESQFVSAYEANPFKESFANF
jgi:septal ring-binding cell division protein DamX